jgi:hypothetical protein
MKYFQFVLPLLFLFAACKPEETPQPEAETSSVRISFTNVVDSLPIVLGGPLQYKNLNGDSFYITRYKYYISNIRLTDNSGNTWSEAESYHLIDENSPASLSFLLNDVPVGAYTAIQFMIGVDSTRNVSGTQSGALDPAMGMFWTWNSGYIMSKFEGVSPSSNQPGNVLQFHIGGFEGTDATQRIVNPSFGSSVINAAVGSTPVVHIQSDAAEWFKTPVTIDFTILNAVSSPGHSCVELADNYEDMFTITAIDN